MYRPVAAAWRALKGHVVQGLEPSDVMFICGIVAVLIGAFAQDCMRRSLGAHAPTGWLRSLRIAKDYRRAQPPRPRWPVLLFYGGFGAGYALLLGALAMLFV